MKINSSVPFPVSPLRWKDSEWLIAINQKDNGTQPEETAGSRYEADFTIVRELTAEAAILAFTRMTSDSTFDKQVIENIEVDGGKAIDVVKEYETKVSSTMFPPLPDSGYLEMGVIYSYSGGAVMVRQPHERTIYTPEQTPALFSFYRDNASAELEWMAGEKVEAGWRRTFGGKTYECLQPHQTQSDWTPDKTIGVLWKEVVVTPVEGEWAIGVAYKVGDIVTYKTKRYSCRQAHTSITTWTPTATLNVLWVLQ